MPIVDLPELCRHLNITTTDDYELLNNKLAAAIAWVEAYTGGPLDPENVPAPINEAILQLVAHLYENREATLIGLTAQALPMGFLDLLEPYRAWCF
jgi:hypothetical protein